MQMTTESLNNGATRVSLEGQLDITGFQAIDSSFNELASRADGMVVDMSGVDFLASIGIRTLVMAAKSQNQRNQKLIILSPHETVEKVLRTAGIDQLIPICESEQEAIEKLG